MKARTTPWFWKANPSGWTSRRVGTVATLKNGFPFESEYFDRSDGIPLIRNRDIGRAQTEMFYTGSIPREGWVESGDVIISMDGDFRVAKWKGPRALLNQRMCALAVSDQVNEVFAIHQIRLALKHIEATTASTTVKHLSTNDIRRTALVLPPIQEQRAIGRFLDDKTTKLDALIQSRRKMAELIAEERARVVTDVVTKGTLPGVSLKPSGVPWIGNIPEHWQIRRIKQVARLASGHTPSRARPDYWLEASIPWFQLTDIWRFRDDSEEFVYETAESISESGLAHSAAELLPRGTVALSRTASVGFSAILGTEMATTQDFANWVPGPLVDSAYLLFALRAMRPELQRLRFGSTHKTIYMPDIGGLVMPLPPIDEQHAIVAYVRAQSKRLLDLRSKIHSAVDHLVEYRATLITAAVTGQIDVSRAA